MTGIYNAATVKSIIAENIKSADSRFRDALILIDCDNFKDINDTYGHLQGDKALVSISDALIKTFRSTDIIGRLGGDEFCVYMKNIPSSDLTVAKCEKLMALIEESNTDYDVTVSIGISLLGHEKTYEELFKRADKALYNAKKKGRNQVQILK